MEANTVEVAAAAHLVEGVTWEWNGGAGRGGILWTMDMEPQPFHDRLELLTME